MVWSHPSRPTCQKVYYHMHLPSTPRHRELQSLHVPHPSAPHAQTCRQDKPTPTPHFCKDLKFLLAERIKDKHEIILMEDFNDELSSSISGITKVVADCNLVDVYAAKHGLEEEVPTYSRGTKQLDYILMTPTVASHFARCGADPFNHQFFSDHRGIYVHLKLEGLFDRNLPPLARPTYRDIRSGSPRLIRAYIMELNQYFVEHNIPERMDRLAESRDDLVAETLDQDITNGMLLAGSKCETNKRLPKSGKLHEAQTALRIYQNVLSQLKNKRNLTLQIEKRQVQLPVALTLPTTIQDTNLVLRKAQRTGRKFARKAYGLHKQHQDENVAALVNAEPGSTKEKILQRVKRAEHTKAMFLRLPSIKAEPS
jgi:hypothetical protein